MDILGNNKFIQQPTKYLIPNSFIDFAKHGLGGVKGGEGRVFLEM